MGLCPPVPHQPNPWSRGCTKETAPISLHIANLRGKSVEPDLKALWDMALRLCYGTQDLPNEVAPNAGQLQCQAALPSIGARGHVPVREPPAPHHTAGTRGQPGAAGRARLTSPLAAWHPLRGKGTMPVGTGLGMAAAVASPVPSSPPHAALIPASKTWVPQGSSGKRVPSAAWGGRPHCLRVPAGCGGSHF